MITQETEDINSPAQFLTLDKHEQETLINWINTNLKPIKSANYRHTSYGLKHYFEHDEANGGRYVTNGMFKGAMLECGFKPSKKHNINWTFNISERSMTLLTKRGLHA